MPPSYLFLLLLLLPSASATSTAPVNPFSPKASLLRRWSRLFPSTDIPTILLSKSSPLNTTQLATFTSYLTSQTLHHHLPSFCAAADLFCDLKKASNATQGASVGGDFENYFSRHFERYKAANKGIDDSFRTYSTGANTAEDSFSTYGKEGNFASYEPNTNVASSKFNKYDEDSTAFLSVFRSYSDSGNVQGQDFKAYGQGGTGTTEVFSSYSENSNVITNGFQSYAKSANGGTPSFTAYGTSSNIVTNEFKSYDDGSNGNTGSFTSYAGSANSGTNNFKAYGSNGNALSENFNNYADSATQPQNTFTTYGRGTNNPLDMFENYGNSTNPTTNKFIDYARDASGNALLSFTTYFGPQNMTSFAQYSRFGTFSNYRNSSNPSPSSKVEPGKFFRQASLMSGRQIPFPDIRDKMPKRSFLPHSLAQKLPLSTTNLPELLQLFGNETIIHSAISRTISDCKRPAVKGETKHCVVSLEDMAQFASSILGDKASVSTTKSTLGWGKNVVVGKVVQRNNGKETKSVSCHQSLFPYLVYYCHMVPYVKVYDVEMVVDKEVNNAVAICHMDTSQWSAKHAAFVALGPAPGKIEVCHFIYENDFIWVASN